MRIILIGLTIALLPQLGIKAQETLPPAISSAYQTSLAALQSCTSAKDIHQMVGAIDSPDWVGVAPSGEKTTRDEAEKQLLGLLSIPAGQRPIPLQKIIYVNVSGKQTLVVYWVYRNTPEGNVGSIVRDTWQQTQAGWLRSLHEKLFPDRPLKLP